MYHFLVVGHGGYPSGVKSALQLLIGDKLSIDAINLDEKITHEEMERQAEAFLKKHEKVVVFADLTGGAPHQKVSSILLGENMPPHHIIISNVSMGMMMDVIMKLQFSPPKDETDALKQIMASINEDINVPSVLCKQTLEQGKGIQWKR